MLVNIASLVPVPEEMSPLLTLRFYQNKLLKLVAIETFLVFRPLTYQKSTEYQATQHLQP